MKKISFYLEKLRGKGNISTLFRGAFSSFVLKVIGTGLIFGVQVIGANLLGANGYGTYAYAFAWVNMLALLGQMGFDTASVRYIAAYETQQEWGLQRGFLRYSSLVVTIVSFLTAFVLALGAWLFRQHISTELLYSFWFGSLLLPIITALKLHNQRFLALKKVFLAQFPLLVLRNALAVVFFGILTLVTTKLTANNFMALMVVTDFTTLMLVVICWQKLIGNKFQGVTPQFKNQEWLHTARAMIIVASLEVILGQSDTIMLGAIAGTTETGLYVAARKIGGLLVFPLLAVNSILSPMVVSLYSQKSHHQLQRIVNIAVNTIFGLTLAIAVGVAISGKFILGLFGSEFTGSYFLLLIHLFGQLVNATAGPVSLLLNMTGHHNDTARILLVTAVINIILNAVLIPNFGAVGASIATAIATIIWNVVMGIIVWKKLKLISIAMPPFMIKSLVFNE